MVENFEFLFKFLAVVVGYIVTPVVLGYFRTSRVSAFVTTVALAVIPLIVCFLNGAPQDFFSAYGASFVGAYVLFTFGRFLRTIKMAGPLEWVRSKRPEQLLMIGTLSFCAAFFLFFESSSKSKKTEGSVAQASTAPVAIAPRLKSDQQKVVRDTVEISKALYLKGEYQACLDELALMKGLVEQDDQAKELVKFCDEAKSVHEAMLKEERKARAAASAKE